MSEVGRSDAHGSDPTVNLNTGVQEVPAALSPTRAGRPRDADIDRRILDAAVHEVTLHGVRSFSVARVAREAGVARNSVYLRWPDQHELIVDALEQGVQWPAIPPVGDYPTELRMLIEQLADVVSRPALAAQFRLLSETGVDSTVLQAYRARVVARGLRQGRAVFDRASERGQLRHGLDNATAFAAVLGALLVSETTATGSATDPALRHRLTSNILLMTASEHTEP